MDTHKRRQLIAALCVVIIVAASVSVFFAYQLLFPPAYAFKNGVNHPQAISNLLKNGTVVLYFTQNNCPPCDFVAPKIADLQSQYKGTDVTVMTVNPDGNTTSRSAFINYDDNPTSRSIFSAYGIQWTPEVFVIRPDGAVANFSMKKDSGSDSFHAQDGGSYNMDFNAIRSAIEEARHG